MYGISVIDGAFEVLRGADSIEPRTYLDADAVSALKGFTDRYNRLLASASYPAAGLLAPYCATQAKRFRCTSPWDLRSAFARLEKPSHPLKIQPESGAGIMPSTNAISYRSIPLM